MAEQAKGAQVIQVTLAATLRDRKYVVGVPERSARRDGAHPVDAQAIFARRAAGSFKRGEDGEGVGVAHRAAASIARKDLIAQVAGVGSEAPLMDTKIGTEGSAALCEDFKIAPAAERKAV